MSNRKKIKQQGRAPAGFQMPQGIPPGMAPRMPQGMPQGMQQGGPAPGQDPQAHLRTIRKQHNPLPMGEEGIKQLRAFSQCPLPGCADDLNKLIGQILETNNVDEDKLLTVAGAAIAKVLRGDRNCQKQMTTRTACIMSEDEELHKLHDELKNAETEVERLQEELDTAVQKMQGLTVKRWETAVKKHGLNPEERHYRIHEDTAIIELIELKCPECTAVSDMDSCKRDIVALLFEQKKENDNDTPSNSGDTESKPGDPQER
jgi:hypothetical protein